MEFIKKNVALVVIILVIVAGLGGFLLFNARANKTPAPLAQEKEVKQMSPSDIGLILSVKPDKKAVIMKVTKLQGIESIEYEVSYDAEVTEEGEPFNIPRGVVGSKIETKGESEIEREVLLGTCSASVCKYDKVTTPVKFIIKVNLSNGEIGAVEDSIFLEE